MNEQYKKIPAVALRGMVILPGMVAHFDVSRSVSIRAIEAAMMEEQTVFLVTQKNIENEELEIENLYGMGIIASVKQVIKLQNSVVRVLIEGEVRARLMEIEQGDCLMAWVDPLPAEEEPLPAEIYAAMMRGIQETFTRYCLLNSKHGKELARQMQEIMDLEKLLDYIGNNLPLSYDKKQKILEAESIQERYETIMIILLNEINIIQIKTEFQTKVKERARRNISCGNR